MGYNNSFTITVGTLLNFQGLAIGHNAEVLQANVRVPYQPHILNMFFSSLASPCYLLCHPFLC